MTQLVQLLLASLGLLAWVRLLARGTTSASRLRLLLEATAAHAVVATLVAVGLVSCAAFRPIAAQALAAAAPLVGLVVTPRTRGRVSRPPATRLELAAATLAVLLALATRPSLEPPRMAGDAGVYATRAIHHLSEGGLRGRILLRDRLRGELLAAFDRDNTSPPNESERTATGRLGGYLPGTYLDPTARGRFEFQFLPGWPMAMALWAGLAGLARLFDVLPFFLALAIALFALVLQRHAREEAAPLAALLLFATSPLLLFFARYSTAEVLLLFLFLFVLHFGAEPSRLGRGLAAAGLLLLALSHSSVFLYAPLPLLVAVEAHRRASRKLALLAALAFGVLLAAVPLTFLLSPRYLHDIYAYSFSFLPLRNRAGLGLAAVCAFYLGGLGLSLSALRPAAARRARWPALRARWPRLAPPTLAALALAIALRGYQLGWTRQLADGAMNVGAWTRRAHYAGAGWPSLVHLNVVSMLLATALVGLPLALGAALWRGRGVVAAPFRALLLAGILLSLGIYTLLRADTPFNYYASRYFLPVFVPCTLLLVGLLPRRVQPPRWLAAALLAAGLLFNLRYAAPLLAAGTGQRSLDAALEIVRRLPRGEVLFVNAEPVAFQTLAIPLASLAGIPVVRVARANGLTARERAGWYCAELGLGQAYWLGPDRPPDDWPLAALELTETDTPERIAYPTRLPQRTRTLFLSSLADACRGRGGRGAAR